MVPLTCSPMTAGTEAKAGEEAKATTSFTAVKRGFVSTLRALLYKHTFMDEWLGGVNG